MKKTILLMLCLAFYCSHAMEPDVFGAWAVAFSNELTAQERNAKQKKLKKYIKTKEDSGYCNDFPLEAKIIGTGLVISIILMVLDIRNTT
jgi:hypothetical protein